MKGVFGLNFFKRGKRGRKASSQDCLLLNQRMMERGGQRGSFLPCGKPRWSTGFGKEEAGLEEEEGDAIHRFRFDVRKGEKEKEERGTSDSLLISWGERRGEKEEID